MTNPSLIHEPDAARRQLRIIWAALISGVVIFGGVVVAILNQPREAGGADESVAQILFYIALAMVITVPMVGLFVRGQVFKSGWEGDVVKPQNYVAGSIIALAMAEGPTLFGIVNCLVSHSLMPNIIVAAIGLTWMIVLFPNGKAMYPQSGQYAVGERK